MVLEKEQKSQYLHFLSQKGMWTYSPKDLVFIIQLEYRHKGLGSHLNRA